MASALLGYDPQTVFNDLLLSADKLVNSYGTKLVSEGMGIASSLLLITVGWSIVTWLITGDGIEALVDSIGSIARYFIVVFILSSWGGGSALIDSYVSGINGLLDAKATISESVTSVMKSIDYVLMEPPKKKCEGAVCSVLPIAVVETATAIVSMAEKIASLPAVIVTYLMKILSSFLLGLMLVAFLGVLILAKVHFAAAFIIGPILVPFLVWKRSEWLFDGWLKFGLIACMTNIVAMLMLTFMSVFITTVQTLAKALNASAAGPLGTAGLDYIVAGLIMIVSGIGAYIMWQVPSIAQGLLSGSGGGSVGGLGRVAGRAINSIAGGATKTGSGGKK